MLGPKAKTKSYCQNGGWRFDVRSSKRCQTLIDTIPKLESVATHRKQTSEAISNRYKLAPQEICKKLCALPSALRLGRARRKGVGAGVHHRPGLAVGFGFLAHTQAQRQAGGVVNPPPYFNSSASRRRYAASEDAVRWTAVSSERGVMKILSSAMAIGILVCCLTLAPVTRGQLAPATKDQPAPDAVAKGRAVLDELVAGQFEKVEAQYSDGLTAALGPGKLADSWKQLLGQTGGFKSVTSANSQPIQTSQLVTLVCAFERATLDATMSFDAEGKLAGIHFRPHKDTTPWSAPAYAKPDTFHEDPVTVKFQHWELPGTLTTPVGDGPFPLVVLVQGSGPHDEDETIGPNKPFKDLAWGLASRGVAVLRYMKRTARYGAKSADDFAAFTVDDEIVNDARAAVELAAKQPKIDAKQIFVLGHSEGGYVAPRIAEGDAQIAGIILLAGPARPIEKLIVEQIRYLATFPGVPPAEAQKQIAAAEQAEKAIESPDLKKTDTVDFMRAQIPGSYFLDLRGYDPTVTAAKLKIRILVLQGGRDYQLSTEDFDDWKKALDGHANATLKLYPDLNHLFQTGEGKSTPTEYDKAGHVSADTVGDIADWVRKGGTGK